MWLFCCNKQFMQPIHHLVISSTIFDNVKVCCMLFLLITMMLKICILFKLLAQSFAMIFHLIYQCPKLDDDVFFFCILRICAKKWELESGTPFFNMFLALSCLALPYTTHMLSLNAFVSSFALPHRGLFTSHLVKVFTHTSNQAFATTESCFLFFLLMSR